MLKGFIIRCLSPQSLFVKLICSLSFSRYRSRLFLLLGCSLVFLALLFSMSHILKAVGLKLVETLSIFLMCAADDRTAGLVADYSLNIFFVSFEFFFEFGLQHFCESIWIHTGGGG